MVIFYTQKGDKGYSRVGKKKIDKRSPFVAALGQLDQLNSFIGVVKSLPPSKNNRISPSLKKTLHKVQENLFLVQANVAGAMLIEAEVKDKKFKIPKFGEEKTKELEKRITSIEKALRPAKGFVVSGTTHISAWLDYLRTLTRTSERMVWLVANDQKIKTPLDPALLPYLNRLSSFLFALARQEAKKAGKKESHPAYK